MDQDDYPEVTARRRGELHQLEDAYRRGSVCALYDALLHVINTPCHRPECGPGSKWDPQREVPAPVWLLEASVAIAANVPTPGRRGSRASRERDRWKDYIRWDAVDDCLRAQAEYRAEIRGLDELLKAKEITRAKYDEACKRRRNPGRTLLDAFGHASDQLAGTVAEGGADAIEKSYKWVRKHGGPRMPSREAQRLVMTITDP